MKFVNCSKPAFDTWHNPKWLLIFSTSPLPDELIDEVRRRFPACSISGLKSFQGVFTSEGFNRGAYALLIEEDDPFLFEFVLINAAGLSSEQCRQKAYDVAKSFENFDKSHDRIILHCTPGYEERVLEGIESALGDDALVFGATSAIDSLDNDDSFLFLNGESTNMGFLIGALRAKELVRTKILGGYLPTRYRGKVTSAEGRTIYSIDNKPALDVYNMWTERVLQNELLRGGLLPKNTAIYPLGRVYSGDKDPSEGYWLSHLVFADRLNRSLTLYSEVEIDTEIVLMRGSEPMLVNRVNQALSETLDGIGVDDIAGCVLTYCAGCTNFIAENMDQICSNIVGAIGEKPFIGFSSFGEQGQLTFPTKARHGNMMCGVLLFLKEK